MSQAYFFSVAYSPFSCRKKNRLIAGYRHAKWVALHRIPFCRCISFSAAPSVPTSSCKILWAQSSLYMWRVSVNLNTSLLIHRPRTIPLVLFMFGFRQGYLACVRLEIFEPVWLQVLHGKLVDVCWQASMQQKTAAIKLMVMPINIILMKMFQKL